MREQNNAKIDMEPVTLRSLRKWLQTLHGRYWGREMIFHSISINHFHFENIISSNGSIICVERNSQFLVPEYAQRIRRNEGIRWSE